MLVLHKYFNAANCSQDISIIKCFQFSDQNFDLEVKVPHNIGRKRLYWPRLEDKIWYTVDKDVTLSHPQKTSHRGMSRFPSRVFTALTQSNSIEGARCKLQAARSERP
ncbi:unnamed protein product [Pleuronectes platessa]|uniref:Uncharacterized protein n=1 Tax=Pleuronectes platessa TaxID=8262 RepID=A0A9N7UGX2_PLEPL|nr:unnamed protein product [Pleuronectes platessa]